MISTRGMDFKLREAADGLGEDSTGKALPLLWGESSLDCGAGGRADGTRPSGFPARRMGGSTHKMFRHPLGPSY